MQPARFDEKAVLVTGAASGIGRETAVLFASRGARLFICDINEDGLAETERVARGYGNAVRADRVDVSSRDAVGAYADAIHTEVPALDVLVNNAGVALGGGFLDTTLADWDWLVGTNLWGVIYGCHFFIPKMAELKRGHVVNVASAAGLVGVAELAAYATTKFGVVGLSEALRDELSPHGVGVSVVCPGIVNTAITRSARLRGANAGDGERERLVATYKRRNFGPDKVAKAILDAVIDNKAVIPVTTEAWALYAMKRAAPGLVPKLLQQVRDRARR